MKTFTYVIKDEVGIHARPAAKVVKEAVTYESTITIKLKDKEADARKLIKIMSLGAKCGDELIVEVDGSDEDTAAVSFNNFLSSNL
ncbi:MAG: HPr family phosphocarrier protein [Lachnospirales bacterium]